MRLTYPGTSRARGLRAIGGGLIFGLAVSPACFAQQPASTPRITGAFRISVAPHVSAACGTSVANVTQQQNAETRLRSAGIVVSEIHNSQLAIDLDCVPVAAKGPGSSLAVHQCLGFSEVVSASNDSQPMLAGTWRKCESYVCASARCEAAANSGLATLVDAFLSGLAERSSQAPVRPPENPTAYANTGATPVERVIFFGLYTMTCLTTLIYWQIRKRSAARAS